MGKYIINGTSVDVYKVGVYRDIDKLKKSGFRSFWRWFKTSWSRKSYWNGYLAESENKARCGTGWTEKQALNNWKRIPEL